MDHTSRLIGLAFVVAWTIFRLVRYLKVGASRPPPPAAPPSVGTPERPRTDTTAAATTASPIEPAGGTGAGLGRNLLAAAMFIGGTVVIWSLLFMLPALEQVPPFVRMIAGVFATLSLAQLVRGAAARRGGAGQRGGADDNNPIK